MATTVETAESGGVTPRELLSADDEESVERLAQWLKSNLRRFTPVLTEAIDSGADVTPLAASAVLRALAWRTSSDTGATVALLKSCLRIVTDEIAASLGNNTAEANDGGYLVSAAVSLLMAKRPSRYSESAIDCLASAGPAGALVLARSFDGVRRGLRTRVLLRLDPADVRELDDNVVVSLAHSVSRLTDDLEGRELKKAQAFLAELGPIGPLESSGIDADEPLEPGERVFHASWGSGTLVAITDETVTVDFGSGGTRTLVRTFARLRHAG